MVIEVKTPTTKSSVGLIADLMRKLGPRACQPRAYQRTTVPAEAPASPDLIDREFTAAPPGEHLVDDTTYLKTGEGCVGSARDAGADVRRVHP
jgi:transposase InsO family protein